jgi:hypothetical protein
VLITKKNYNLKVYDCKVWNQCIGGTRCVTLVTNTVIRHEWGKDPIAIMTNGTDLWYRCSVTVNKIKLNKNSFQQHFSYIVAVSFIGEETRVPGKNHRPVASHWQTLSNNVASRTPLSDRLFELATSEDSVCVNIIDAYIRIVCKYYWGIHRDSV